MLKKKKNREGKAPFETKMSEALQSDKKPLSHSLNSVSVFSKFTSTPAVAARSCHFTHTVAMSSHTYWGFDSWFEYKNRTVSLVHFT